METDGENVFEFAFDIIVPELGVPVYHWYAYGGVPPDAVAVSVTDCP